MADTNQILKLQAKAASLIDSWRLTEAMDTVGEMLVRAGLGKMTDEVNHLRETYKYMVHYMLEGVPDASRDKVLSDIRDRLLTLSDHAVREEKGKENSDIYSSALRYNKLRGESIRELMERYSELNSMNALSEAADAEDPSIIREKEAILTSLFDAIFISFGAKSDYRLIVDATQSDYPDDLLASQTISALTLAELFYYDKEKLESLLDIYENARTARIAAKSLLGIFLTIAAHPARVDGNSALKARLSLWNDDIETYRRLRETLRVIVGTRDTERVAAKMKDEVIPELTKIRPELLKSMQDMPAEIDPESMEINPEWEELLDKSGLSKKMQELSEMQNDGADLMMVTFSNLKQFPFFNKVAHWFLPFHSNNTDLNLAPELREVVEMLSTVGSMICDSDLYSLALAVSHMPERQRNLVSSQFSAQFAQMKEQMKEDAPKSSTPEFDMEVVKAVRDLYRFFKLFRNRQDFNDPFRKPINFISLPVIGEMLGDEEVVRLIGEFYFKRGYYREAFPLIKMVLDENPDDPSLWEKYGLCLQAMGKFSDAKDAYTRAMLMKQPTPWLLKRLAQMNRLLNNPVEYADYYEQAVALEPESVPTLMNAGKAWLEADSPSNALKHFYHANYLLPDNIKILRAVAWAELLNGNFVKSADYYAKIIAVSNDREDFLNAGHAAMMTGNLKEAVNFYRLSAEAAPEEFELDFKTDLPELLKLGLDEKTASIVFDLVKSRDF